MLWLYLLKVTFTEFFVFTHTITQIFVIKPFSFPSANKTYQADGGISAASITTLLILGCQIVYSDDIHCSSIISNEYVFFLVSDSLSFPIVWSISRFFDLDLFAQKKIIFFWRLSFKPHFKIEYFCRMMDLNKMLGWTRFNLISVCDIL